MADIHYEIVEHDGGWAYRFDGVFSETFRTRDDAHRAAEIAGAEQARPGEAEAILYQDETGEWHEEMASGQDRPRVEIDDDDRR